ncbi:MAG: D-2-hydroxyacid dehydrogenase [Anaerolineae bacterium]|nr:D-2-hydroxyacid dehydrogenase [Anaerolineae bacterium]
MKILIGSDRYGLDTVIPELSRRFPHVDFELCTKRENLVKQIADADAVIGWLSRDEFLAGKKLKWVQSPSTGVDAFVRIPELRDGDVILTNARGTHGAPLAEHAMAMILTFTRGMKAYINAQAQKHWDPTVRAAGLTELTGSTMGIVGYGVVGQAVAERARGFGMRILAVDRYPSLQHAYIDSLEPIEGLERLLKESDYVVVTLPYTPENDNFIGAAEMALMKPTALLVGVSRGGVIDEHALLKVLQEKKIAGAALDVVRKEPMPPDNPLWDLDNLLITPHAAGGSQLEAGRIRAIFVDNVRRFVEGEFPLRNTVNKKLGY